MCEGMWVGICGRVRGVSGCIEGRCVGVHVCWSEEMMCVGTCRGHVCVCEQLPTALHVKPLCCTYIVDIVTFPNMALTLNLLLFNTASITPRVNSANKKFRSFLT